MLPGVTLGGAGANYGNMDLPFSVDFAGPRESVRCYFIPDGRHDPYGKVGIPAGGGHDKTLHLRPFLGVALLEPAPYRGVLELNGQEVGRPLLEALPAVIAEKEELANLKPIPISPTGTGWEAEAGVVRSPMVRGDDADASGGKFVWMPGEPGERGGGSGSASWLLQVGEPGTYYTREGWEHTEVEVRGTSPAGVQQT